MTKNNSDFSEVIFPGSFIQVLKYFDKKTSLLLRQGQSFQGQNLLVGRVNSNAQYF